MCEARSALSSIAKPGASSSGKSSKLRTTRAATTSRPATARGSSITRTSSVRGCVSMPASGRQPDSRRRSTATTHDLKGPGANFQPAILITVDGQPHDEFARQHAYDEDGGVLLDGNGDIVRAR